VKLAGGWTYLYRAADQHGQVIDVLGSRRHDGAAATGAAKATSMPMTTGRWDPS
jgi:transposase-like protein